MPVTATLANQLYQQLGETAATALTDWLHTMDTKVHEKVDRLNEAAYARFSAEIQAKFAEYDAKWTAQFAELRLEVRSDIARVESRLAWQMVATMATLFGVLIALGEKFLRA